MNYFKKKTRKSIKRAIWKKTVLVCVVVLMLTCAFGSASYAADYNNSEADGQTADTAEGVELGNSNTDENRADDDVNQNGESGLNDDNIAGDSTDDSVNDDVQNNENASDGS